MRIEQADEIQSRPRISGRRRKPYRFRAESEEENISIQRRKPIRLVANDEIDRPRYHSRYRTESLQGEVEDFPVHVSRKNRVNGLNLQPNHSESEGQRLREIENGKYEQEKLPHVVSSTEGHEDVNLQEISSTQIHRQSEKYSTEKYTVHETDESPSNTYNENIKSPVRGQETPKIKYHSMKEELNGEVIGFQNIKELAENSNNGLILNADEKIMTEKENTTSDIFKKTKTDQKNLHISELPLSKVSINDQLVPTILKSDNLEMKKTPASENITNKNNTFRELKNNQNIRISSKSNDQDINSTQPNLSNFTYSDKFQESIKMKVSPDVITTITLHELLKMKNMTLQDVIKQNEAGNPNGAENNEHSETLKLKLRARPYVRRLPTPSELFSRKKLHDFVNTIQTNTNKTDIINDNYIQTTSPSSKYNDLSDKNLTLIEMSNSSPSKVSLKVITESPMPLLMQEIDAINPIKEEENKKEGDKTDKIINTTRNRGKQLNNTFSDNSFINETNSTNNLKMTKSSNSMDATYSLDTIFNPTFKDADDDIIDLLKSQGGSIHLARILMSRNMTLKELIEHRERGSSHQHLSDIFENSKVSGQEENHTENKTKHLLQTSENGFKVEDSPLHISIINDQQNLQVKSKSSSTELLKQNIINSPKATNLYSTSNEKHSDFPFQNMNDNNQENLDGTKNLLESITSQKNNYDNYNQSSPRNNFESYNADTYSHSGVATDITNDEEGLLLYRDHQGVNDVSTAYDIVTAGVTEEDKKNLNHHRVTMSKDDSIFPPTTKSAIVASSIVLGVGISVFLAVFIGCKLRQRALIQHGRRVGKMAAKSPILEGQVRPRNGTVMLVSNGERNFRDESFIMNSQLSDFYVEPRRYYLWRTIRKTLKYK